MVGVFLIGWYPKNIKDTFRGPSSDFRGFASFKKFGKCDSFFSPQKPGQCWPRNLINSKNLLIAHLLPLSHCPKSDEGPETSRKKRKKMKKEKRKKEKEKRKKEKEKRKKD